MGMRKFFLLLAVSVALISTTAHAHIGALGIEGGSTFGSAFIDPDLSPGFKIGPYAGIIGDLRLVEPWYLESGAFWIQNGAQIEPAGVEADVTFDYLAVPVRIKWLWLMDTPINPFVFAGAVLGFNLNSSGETEGTIAGFQTDLDDSFKMFDVGIEAGLGLNLDVMPHIRLFARGTYAFWALDIAEDDGVLNVDSWRSHEIRVGIGATWIFGPDE